MDALENWDKLNEAVMATDDEEELKMLLNAERRGERRKTFIKRIQHRLNKVRGLHEREAIIKEFF